MKNRVPKKLNTFGMKVLKNVDPKKPTRLYADDGPAAVGATFPQLYTIGSNHPVWRLVTDTQAQPKP